MTVLIVLQLYFPLAPFPLQKTQTRHTNQSLSKHRKSDLLRVALQLLFTSKKQCSRSLIHPFSHIIKGNPTSAHRFVKYSLFSRNAGKWKGDHGSQSSWRFPPALHVCQLLPDSSGWPFSSRARVVIRGCILDPHTHPPRLNAFFFSSSCCLLELKSHCNLWNDTLHLSYNEVVLNEHFAFLILYLQSR